MGDSSQTCRGFETPTLGNDLWPMGFDVDLALDAPGVRKGPGGGLGSGGLGSSGLSSMQAGGGGAVGGGYGDMHHLAGLSSILPRIDDLHPGDICQMTDLTNSLPKGDSETAQSLLAKLACQDLGPDLSSGADHGHKELESSLFGQAPAGMGQGHSSTGQGIILPHKAPLESADVYGRITCFGGKLVLQLRHINVNTNYTLNVSVCWLCGEKVSPGSQLCTHKHSLHGMFQANDEFVQLDIEHFIIPDQALDPHGTQDVPAGVLAHPDHSSLHHGLTVSRDLELAGNLTSGGDPLTIGTHSPVLHYTPGQDTALVPPLTSAPTLMTPASNLMTPTSNLMTPAMQGNHSCMNPSFGQLSLPGMPITTNQNNLSHDLTGMGAAGSLPQVSQPLCSVNNPMFDLTHSDPAPTMAVSSLSDTKTPIQSNQMVVASSSYSLGNHFNSFTINSHLDASSLHNPPPPHREVLPRNKHLLQYQTTQFMATTGDYTGHTPDMVAIEKHAEVSCLTPLHTVTTTFDVRQQRQEFPQRKAETGAKKRKSRAQRKPSIIQMKDYTKIDPSQGIQIKPFNVESMETLPQKPYNSDPMTSLQTKSEHTTNRQLVRADASIDDWIKHNLQGGDLIVSDNTMKPPATEQKYHPQAMRLDEQKTEVGCDKAESQLSPSVKPREPDQTSRLAAHMLSKGIDLLCRLCSQDFGKDIQKYKIHMKEHGVEEMSYFACYFCPKTFGKGKHYRQHLKTHIRTRRFTCRLCSASYSREAKLRRHVLTHSQDYQNKEHKCPKCPKSFVTKEYLHSHMKIHAGKKFKCETCGYLCSSPFNLETHRMKHTDDKPFKCEQCEKTFVRRDFLDKHMEQVHKNKKSKCEVCGKLFSRKDVLKRHLAVHNNKTYDCEICAKKFSRKDRLATHTKVHKLRNDYKCSLCPSSFTRKNVLDKHEKIHKTKEQCKVCHKFLASKIRLESHMKLHEKDSSGSGPQDGEDIIKCEICEKSLTSKHILRKHMKLIHGKFPEKKKKKRVETVEREKKFVCHWCSKGFTRSCNLNTHLLKAHSKDLEEDEFEDDLPSVLQPLQHLRDHDKKPGATTTSPTSLTAAAPYHSFSASGSLHSTMTTVGTSLAAGSTCTPFPLPAVSLPTCTPPPTQTAAPPNTLQLSAPHFPASAPPDSPINLSTDAITAAAYLLAYPSYPY